MNANYDAVIEDFKRMIADAEAGIRAIERLKATDTQTQATEAIATFARVVSDARDGSVPNRIREFLEKGGPQASFTTDEIAAGIGPDVNLRTVQGALQRLVANDKIERRERGKYGARRGTYGLDAMRSNS